MNKINNYIFKIVKEEIQNNHIPSWAVKIEPNKDYLYHITNEEDGVDGIIITGNTNRGKYNAVFRDTDANETIGIKLFNDIERAKNWLNSVVDPHIQENENFFDEVFDYRKHWGYDKKVKNIIKETVDDYLNKGRGFEGENLDLNNRDNVVAWLDKNAPESIFDDEGNINWSYTDPITGEDLETLIYTYMEKYDEVTSESEIEIYRMVKLNSIKDLDLKNVGVFWSFEEDGVGVYGVGQKFSGDNPFILNAIVNTDDIDWEQGFYSFLAYGKSEFECHIKKGSKCLITHINEKELEPPIEAVC